MASMRQEAHGDQLAEIAELVVKGRIKVDVAEVLPLGHARNSPQELSQSGHSARQDRIANGVTRRIAVRNRLTGTGRAKDSPDPRPTTASYAAVLKSFSPVNSRQLAANSFLSWLMRPSLTSNFRAASWVRWPRRRGTVRPCGHGT